MLGPHQLSAGQGDLRQQRIVIADVGAFAEQPGDERDRGRLPQVLHARLVADPDDDHPGPVQLALVIGEDLPGPLDDPLGAKAD